MGWSRPARGCAEKEPLGSAWDRGLSVLLEWLSDGRKG